MKVAGYRRIAKEFEEIIRTPGNLIEIKKLRVRARLWIQGRGSSLFEGQFSCIPSGLGRCNG